MNIDIPDPTPNVTNSLDTLLDAGDHSGRPFNVLVGSNMGNRTLVMSVPMATFYEISEVANKQNLAAIPAFNDQPVAQRRLDEGHAKKLAIFILKGLIDTARRGLEKAGQQPPQALLTLQ